MGSAMRILILLISLLSFLVPLLVIRLNKEAAAWTYEEIIDKALPHWLRGIPLPERIQNVFGIDEKRTADCPLRVLNFP